MDEPSNGHRQREAGWFSSRCVCRLGPTRRIVCEERLTLWQAAEDFDQAIALAKAEAAHQRGDAQQDP
ncbi:hypothetical protein ABGB07_27985 [Micromonosporaceae bacterium B7E4]